MSIKAFLITFVFCLNFNSFAAELIFKKEGKEIKRFTMDELKKIPSKSVSLYHFWRKKEIHYEGLDFYQLLNQVYGKSWKKAKRISFFALDGYKQIAIT
ncbi:MAG: hypothetical protein ACPGJV_12310 [Bacteriovoracaceae bacterium]